uniref:Uncharacterized protein n=1 Tax=Eutreptiella gymnastica TaxID=73025 RepID=A0A7S4G1C9_9EUGL
MNTLPYFRPRNRVFERHLASFPTSSGQEIERRHQLLTIDVSVCLSLPQNLARLHHPCTAFASDQPSFSIPAKKSQSADHTHKTDFQSISKTTAPSLGAEQHKLLRGSRGWTEATTTGVECTHSRTPQSCWSIIGKSDFSTTQSAT